MSLIKFLSSKTFLKQLGLAVVAIVVLSFILLKWLNISTNHGDFHTVPNLTGKSISVAQIELEQNNLELDAQLFFSKYSQFSTINNLINDNTNQILNQFQL
mgnify:CR=1 FL=1